MLLTLDAHNIKCTVFLNQSKTETKDYKMRLTVVHPISTIAHWTVSLIEMMSSSLYPTLGSYDPLVVNYGSPLVTLTETQKNGTGRESEANYL